MATELATAYVSLAVESSKIPGQIAKGFAGADVEGERAGRRAGSRFSSGFGTVLSGAKLGAVALGGLAAAGVAWGVKIAASNEQARISFTTMLGSAQKADTFLRDLQAFAAKTPFEFPELQTAASSLISAGIEAGKVIPIMTTLGDVTSGMGTGSEGVRRATVALQQMSAAGRITGEDLNQLRDAGIPVYDLLASATGKSKEEVVKLAQAGKLGKDELAKMMSALESGKGLERFSGLMDKQSESLSGLWSTFKDTLGMGLAKAIEPLIPLMKEGLGKATELLATTLPTVVKALGEVVSWSLQMVEEWQKGVGSGGQLRDTLTQIKDVTVEVVKWGMDHKEVLLAVVAAIALYRIGMIGYAAYTKAAAIATGIATAAQRLNTAGLAVQNSTLGTWVGVKALEVGAWLRSTAATVASTAAAAANRAVYGVQYLTTWIATKAVEVATWARGAAATVASTAATVAHVAVQKGAAAASRIWAAAQWVLNAAMTANPIGLVIAAIVGLIAIFVLAYKKSDTFRAIVQAAWAGIKAAASAVVGWFQNTAWPWMRQAFQWIGDKAKWLWSLVSLQFRIGKAAVEAVVGWVLRTAWPWMRDAFQNIADKGKWLWANVLKPTFDLIKTGVGKVKDAFVTAKDGIGTAWKKLEGLAKAPIKFVIQTVLNKGLIAGFNWLSGKIGGPHINDIPLPSGFAMGGVLPGYTPGRDVHRFFNPRLGFLDLSGGEGILRPEATRALGGEAGIAAINAAARQGRGLDVHAHAGGGILDWIKSKASSAFAWVSDKASDVFRAVTNPLDFLRGKLPKIPGGATIGAYGKAVVDKGLHLGVTKIQDLWKTFKKSFDELGGAPGSGNAARTVSELTAVVKKILPDTIVTSGYRPGSITALGNVSQHSKGLAIDFVPHSVSRFRKVKNAFPNAYQLFYSPADGETLLNGNPWRMDSTTKSGHWDHIHLSNKRYADGGVVPKPLVFDRGGVLPVGDSLVRNNTGAPEPLARIGTGTTVVYVTLSIDDIRRMRELDDFFAMLERARLEQRAAASGRVSA